jgi:VIT1/CCC1 family predicted Fe2+/Mn2+ transporter
MDPLTLFALANAAVSAVKSGCKLYKDIKGAAGEVKDVLKDLDSQFHKLYEDKPVPPEAKKQLQEEKARVVELNKKANADEHTGIYQEIGNHLGAYYDNFYKCIAVFEEEERRAKKEVYTGDDSLGKRALQRVLMRKQLQQMEVDLRELMVYQSPKELGALYTEVEDMMKQMGKEQKVLVTQQMQRQAIETKRRSAKRKQLNIQVAWGIGVLIVIFFFFFVMMLVAQSRQQMYPQYGNELFPKSEEQRRREAQPHVYVGR